MRRLHLLEIHEQPWCPAAWRDGLTDLLQIGMRATDMFGGVLPRLVAALRRTSEARLVDLCAGGGGIWGALHGRLRRDLGDDLSVTLTDLFPSATGRQRIAAVPGLAYLDRPVDARRVPGELAGFRTMFNAFHQFPPDEARAVLADAVAHRQGIAVFEGTHRSWWGLFLAASLPPVALLLTPFIRPFRWSRLFWTYVVPVLPLLLAFDAVVSSLRTYDLDELDALVESLGEVGYRWERGQAWARRLPQRVTWLVGWPAEAEAEGAAGVGTGAA